MPDITLVQLKQAYDAALEQIAAESFLEEGMLPGLIIDRLQIGNNPPGSSPSAEILDGNLRMTLKQAQAFESRYTVIDAYQNDATGFSAVALRDTANPGRVVLAERSTEINNDRARDIGADFQIFTNGFAFDQILSAQDFLNHVRPQLLPGETIDLVGYSLSGNIVRTLAAMYPTEVNQTAGANVVFNATGLGGFSDLPGQNRPRSVVLLEMMNLYRQVEADPNSATNVPVLLLPLQLTAIAAPPIDRTNPNGNVYPSPRNDFAEAYVQTKYTTFYNDFGTTVVEPSVAQYFGVAMSGFDAAVVANSGSHPVPVGVAIEGQPVVNIPGIASRFDYLNTHSLTLLTDSLALQILFKEIDPNMSTGTITSLFQASSASSASTLTQKAEGDTLEKALDPLRQIFLGPTPTPQTLPSANIPGSFGNLANRTTFYEGIAAVKTALAGGVFTIEPFVELNTQGTAVIRLAPSEVNAAALENTDRGLAFRYALKNLNPFAVVGADYSGLGHASNGALTLFDPATGFGELTEQYLKDRAAFLEEKIELNLLNDATSTGNIHFKDFAPNGLEITTAVDLRVDQEFLFGSDGDEGVGVLAGNSKADHLYGGGGNDLLEGGDGRDYLQGDAGIDRLDGGEEADRMAGGTDNDFYIVDNLGDEVIEGFNNGTDRVESSVSFTLGANVEHLTLTGTADLNGTGNELNNDITGNSGINRLDGQGGTDHLIGGDKNDILIGGTGDNDLLEGGAGFDTYIYNAGDGTDRIEDSDAQGQIIFQGHRLLGGIHDPNDPLNTYTSLDGLTTYVLSGTDLIVNGVLTVNENFQSGQFGIQLRDVSEANYDNGYPETTSPDVFGLVNNIVHYGSGDDVDFGERGNDQLFGEGGNDALEGNTGDDRLSGGAGNDFLRGDNVTAPGPAFNIGTDAVWGRDVLDGGDGDDTLIGDWGDDILRGGAGVDLLYGDCLSAAQGTASANDFLDGGEGNDELHGQEGDDVLYGGAGNDFLSGEAGNDVEDGGDGDDLIFAYLGNDSLAGGAGLDQLYGDVGNDILDGGDDADTLHGGDGADELFGGAGDDLLFGDGLNNPSELSAAGGADFLDGGAGNDHLEGGLGDDTLFGGTENDVLFGEEGADSLFGDEGADELQGGTGNDFLSGDAGDDLLFGQAGDDTLDGGDGDDTLAGNDGTDTLVGGAGSEVLEGGQGNDRLIGGAGQDTYRFSLGHGQDTITDTVRVGEGNLIQFGTGITLGSLSFIQDQAQQTLTIHVAGGDSLRLLGFDPNTFNYVVDTLAFADGTQVLLADQLPLPGGLIEGTDESNVIRTGSSDDTIFAGAGNDVVISGAGNDVIVGGVGADILQGGAGQDTYVFSAGDGADTISDTASEGNRLVFGAGVSSSALTLGRGNNNSLDIQGPLPTERVRLTGGLLTGASPIATFEFADGTVLTFDQFVARGIALPGTSEPDTIIGTKFSDRITGAAGNDVLLGQEGADQIFGGQGDDVMRGGDDNDVLNGDAGNDSLEGEAGDDVLVGGAGDDQLLGGGGADTYRFNLGDGIDSISDPNSIGEESRVVFGPGISSSSLTLATSFGQVIVRPGTADEGTKNGANGSDVLGFRAVDKFEFTDGTSITYAELVARGFDIVGTLFDDQLFGTNVVDRITGGAGNDQLEGGAGDDTFFFNQGDGLDSLTDQATADAGNRLVFGPGIVADTIRLHLTERPFDSSAFSLQLEIGTTGEGVRFDTFDSNDALGLHAVEYFVFADGATLTFNQLLERGIEVTGTVDDDVLTGTNVTDLLDGGAGNDELRGGEGNDVYLFGRGSGQDVVIDRGGSLDAIRLAADVTPSDVTVMQEGYDLVLGIAGTSDRLTLSFFFLVQDLQVEQVQFANGTVWDAAFLRALVQSTISGTAGSDTLIGTAGNDQLAGLGGADTITGLAGNDRLDGGTGADQLSGGSGDDLYVVDDAGDVVAEFANEGVDTIQSSITYTLGVNVENLTLTGNAAINGTGNALDNVLRGNGAANVLTGGAGNDTYAVHESGDVVIEGANEGIDTVQSSITYTLGANVENLILTGSAAINATGNAFDNVLVGNASINMLAGGAGNDTYVIGREDLVFEAAGEGIDTIESAESYTLGAYVENLTLVDSYATRIDTQQSSQDFDGIGNALDNVLMGNRGRNFLDGGLGADMLSGGAGDDSYVVDNVGDVVTEHFNEGMDTVESSISYTLSAHVENLALTGSAAINGKGNALDNFVGGNDAENILDGAAGNDVLAGGAGHDTYVFGRGAGQDIVGESLGESSTVLVTAGVSPIELNIYNANTGLVLNIAGTTDTLTLGTATNLDIRFADGTVWNSAIIQSRAVNDPPASNGTPENEGDDVLVGGVGNNELIGGLGNDQLIGGFGDDRLYGLRQSFAGFASGSDNDTLLGGPGSDILYGSMGNDFLDGGTGNDLLIGGLDHDTFVFGRGYGYDTIINRRQLFSSDVSEESGSALDVIRMAPGLLPSDLHITLGDGSQNPFSNFDLVFHVNFDPDDQLIYQRSLGFYFDNPPSGYALDHVEFSDGTIWTLATVLAMVQSPTVTGTEGDDILNGVFAPIDQMLIGGLGHDRYLVAQQDTIVELPNEGIDTIEWWGGGLDEVPFTLPANVENFRPVLGGEAGDVAGNELDNVIIGSGQDNVLDGMAGNDILIGGSTRRVDGPPYTVGPGRDILIGGFGNDRLVAVGDNFDLDVRPLSGDDVLIGGPGDDTYVLDHPGHIIVELAGEGSDTVETSVNYTLGENVENLTLVGFSDSVLTGTGNALDNVMRGNDEGTNVLNGLAGDDTLAGGQYGNDTLRGGAGNDIYLFKVGDGIDTIEDATGPGEGNRIQFGVGIVQNDLTFTHDQVLRTLTIQVGTSGTDQLILKNFDPTNVNGSFVVETLAFADGTNASLAALLGLGSPVNHAPTVATPLADQTVQEDVPLSIQVPANTFADQDAGDVLTYSASLANGGALPTWLSFNNTTRIFSGTPDDAQVGTLDLRMTATDQENLSVSDIFRLTVVNANEAPTAVSPLADQQATEDAPFSLVVPIGAFADVDLGDMLTYSATLANGSPLPAWLSFNAVTRTFTGTPLNDDVGSLNIAVKATDLGGLSATNTFALAIQNVNDAPTVANPLVDQTVLEDAPFSIQVPGNTFADEDAGDVLSYSASLANGSALPTWLSFNATTRIFTGTPDDAQVGSLDLRVTATDNGNLTVSDVFTLTVTNVNDAPTIAAPLANQTILEDASFSLVVPANTFADQDVIQGDQLTYSASLANGSTLPLWLSFNATTRTFTGTPLNSDVGTLNLAITATDLGGLSATDTFAFTVQNVNDAPTVAVPIADQQATQGTVFSLVVPATTFADVDAGDTLTYSATLSNGASLPTWLSFNPVTRTFTGTPQAGDVGAIDVRVTATDQGNLNAADAFALTIVPSGGTAGNDTLIGTSGNDVLDGLAGDDVLRGLAGNDTLIGGAGNDLLDGGLGTDSMTGGTGNDTYVVDAASDVVTESLNSGTDTVQSSITYSLGANVENLTLTGTAAINGTGNALDNVLTGNSAANTLTGGAGNDVYVIGAGDTVVETANAGLDTVLSDVTTTLSANVELLVLNGASAINGTGNSLANTLSGNSAGNTLDGGVGADILAGLDGNDTYLVDNAGDLVIELANNGIDTVQSTVTYTLTANVENLTLTGTAAINGTGNILDNVLLGNGANNTLTGGAGNDMFDGGAGNDTMVGGTGNDTYVVTAVGDVVTENANEGTDTVQSSLAYTLGANVENLTLTGTTAINGTGNGSANVMIGNSGANVLSGAGGADTLRGGVGNDTLNGGSGNDIFLFGRGDGQDLVQDNSGTADKLLYDAGINPLDLVISRQANDLRLSIHGSTDRVTVQNWYSSSANRTETIQAGNGQTILSTQVDQLIQAMAGFTAQTGLTWDQAIDQRPQEVQTVLAASWQ